MSCNCTEKDKKISRYTDDGKGAFVKTKGVRKIIRFFANLFLLVLAVCMSVLALPVMIIVLPFRAIMLRKSNAFSVDKIVDILRKTTYPDEG